MLFWIYHLYSEAFCFFWLYIGLLFYPMGFMVICVWDGSFYSLGWHFVSTVVGFSYRAWNCYDFKIKGPIFWKPPEPWKPMTVDHSTDQSSQSGTSLTSIVGGLLQLVSNYLLLVSFNLFRYKLCFRCWVCGLRQLIIFFSNFHIFISIVPYLQLNCTPSPIFLFYFSYTLFYFSFARTCFSSLNIYIFYSNLTLFNECIIFLMSVYISYSFWHNLYFTPSI